MFYSAEDFNTLLAPLYTATKDFLEWIMVPSHDALLSKTIVKEYPFEYTFDEICDKPFLGLHTSGTTGHPKPLYFTHAITPIYAAQGDESLLPADYPHPPVLKEVWEHQTCLSTFPLYHVSHISYLFPHLSPNKHGELTSRLKIGRRLLRSILQHPATRNLGPTRPRGATHARERDAHDAAHPSHQSLLSVLHPRRHAQEPQQPRISRLGTNQAHRLRRRAHAQAHGRSACGAMPAHHQLDGLH